MKFTADIETYLRDMAQFGRLNSKRSVASYRAALERFADQVGNRDPRELGRIDVKDYLANFPHANTQRRQRSMLISFFDWLMEEGERKDNPARQTRAPKAKKPEVYRLTLDETRRFLLAANTSREKRIAFLGVCAGLRREELRLLQGRHLARPGWVWVSSDIAKGGHERWVFVIADLEPVIAEILAHVGPDDFVIPAQQFLDPGVNRTPFDKVSVPTEGKAIWRIVRKLGKRAGIAAPVHPHLMRHAFADHLARHAGVRSAQAMLGHASISTTQGYLNVPTLDELAASVRGFSFAGEQAFPSQTEEWRRWESNPREIPSITLERFLEPLDSQVALYIRHFRGAVA